MPISILSPAPSGAGPASDVKLAPASDIIPAGDDDLALDLPSPSGDFPGLQELEVDLEAESSRILSPEDVAKVKSAAQPLRPQRPPKAANWVSPRPTAIRAISTSDIGLAATPASGTGLTGLSAFELEDDDDDVLGDGSDVTLSGESSGINIISPSDSGLALDEVTLDLSGSSPIGSSLDLGNISARRYAARAARRSARRCASRRSATSSSRRSAKKMATKKKTARRSLRSTSFRKRVRRPERAAASATAA